MALGKRLINTGAAAAAGCTTDSVQAFGADSAYSSNIALYQLDGNDDDTTTNYNGTSDTGVTYSATGAKFGQAANFNGSSSEIIVSSFASLSQVGISMWVNMPDISQQAGLIARYGSYREFAIYMYGGDLIASIYYNGSNGNATQITASTYMSNNTWHHIAYTADGVNKPTLYIDGVEVGSAQSNNNTYYTSLEPLDIGHFANVSSYNYEGKIEQVRIFDKALSAEKVQVLYNETTDTASNTNPFSEGAGVALYSLDFDSSEASGYYDGESTDVDFGVGGAIGAYGARFNGSSSKIEINSPIVNVSNDYTVSMWVNASDVTTFTTIYENINTDGYLANQALITILNGTIRLYVAPTSGSSTIYSYNFSGASLSVNTWYHLVFVVKTNSNHIAYIDGTPYSSTYLSSTTSTPSGFTTIGYGNTNYFDGSIDQVRIFSKALDSTEVGLLAAETACVHTATANTADFPSTATAVAHYPLDNSAEDNKGTNDGTESNIEYRFGRFGQAAVFNGSSSYINLNHNTTYSDLTMSAWVNVTSTSSRQAIFGKWYDGSSRSILFMIESGGVLKLFTSSTGGNTIITTGGTLTANTWHFVCFTFQNGGDVTITLDNSTTTTTQNTSINNNNQNWLIGMEDSRGGDKWNGSIDQVRIFSTALSSSQVSQLYNEKPEVDTSNFKTVLYEGNGGSQYISNVGFEPDLVWIKERTGSAWHILTDSVRGANKTIYSNDTYQEESLTNVMNSFESNGFMVAYNSAYSSVFSNKNNEDYVAWVWKGGGEAVNIGVNSITGSTPSIASDVSANTAAGFSIVKYTGNGTAGATIGHGLSSTPEFIITKGLSGTDPITNWKVYNSTIGNTKYLHLNASTAAASASVWNNTSPTSSVFSLGSSADNNGNGTIFIAYCFHSVAGYSKIGSYTGAGSGTRVYTTDDGTSTGTGGFKPSFIMLKNADTGGTGFDWYMYDVRRDDLDGDDNLEAFLTANNNTAETISNSGSNGVVMENDGFKLDISATSINGSGDTFIYMAFK